MNGIDELDGMIKIKGKCGYEIIGGCKELKQLKKEKEKQKEENKIFEQTGKTLAEEFCKQNELATTYKQALEEIRYLLSSYRLKYDTTITASNLLDNVVNKINEVLND